MVFGLEIRIHNPISHNDKRIRITGRHWIASDPNNANKNKENLNSWWKCSSFIYIPFVYLQNQIYPDWWNTFRLVVFEEYLDCPSTRFSLAVCLGRTVWSCAGLHHVTCTWTNHKHSDSVRDYWIAEGTRRLYMVWVPQQYPLGYANGWCVE